MNVVAVNFSNVYSLLHKFLKNFLSHEIFVLWKLYFMKYLSVLLIKQEPGFTFLPPIKAVNHQITALLRWWVKARSGIPLSTLCSWDHICIHLLHPGLGSLAQERHGPVGLSPEEATEMIERVVSSGNKLEWIRVVQLGEEKALGRSHRGLPALKDGL